MKNGSKQGVNAVWDVVVIGGGPAGMMSAGRASELGAKVLLLEKNDSLGKKLLITGGGRCNVTNAQFDTRKLLAKFKGNDQFLFSAFSQWSVKETLDFFHSRAMPTKIENELRVFPVSNTAQSVWDTLVEYLKKGNVTVRSNASVVDFVTDTETKKILSVKLKNGEEIVAKRFILATGGKSRPETGSTGDGFKWLKKLGHTVTEPVASLVPITLSDKWIKTLSGVTLPEVKLTLLQNGKKQDTQKGKILFTHVGVSGPTILNMSSDIAELLKYGEVIISLDLFPAEDYGKLNTKLQELFKTHTNKKFKNVLGEIIPGAVATVVVEFSNIKADTKCNSVTREERLALVQLLKAIPLHVSGLLGVDKAIVTSGGVALSEVDFKTMQSRLYSNLYLVGDILDIDRPSGGYSLQLCWTTGYISGTHSATKQ